MQSIYLETSVIGYLASRPSADLVVAGNQKVTTDWWTGHRHAFHLTISQAVVAECASGDPSASEQRLAYIENIPVLEITDQAQELAESLLAAAALPHKAAVDALHIAVASVWNIDYLLTWNCKHIANPAMRRIIEKVLCEAGTTPPIICTPQELIYAE